MSREWSKYIRENIITITSNPGYHPLKSTWSKCILIILKLILKGSNFVLMKRNN